MSRTEWTPAMDAQIATMRAAGHSASEIGAEVGATASAVSARADRLGLPHMPTGRRVSASSPKPRPVPTSAPEWTLAQDASLQEWHAECDGDWRKIAPKVGRSDHECRARFRQLLAMRPRRIEVERRCLCCSRTRMIPVPMRICDECKNSETWQHAAATP